MAMRGYRILLVLLLTALSTIHAAPSPSSEVDVFTMGEGGYYCIKIPYFFVTFNGTLLAFGEARWKSCSDFTATDLVFKRSTDNGKTWSKLRILYSNTSFPEKRENTIGNACPLQLRINGRILVPFDRNNREVWQTWSDDDGKTWHPNPERVTGGTHADWQWIGTGPPGAIQLLSGRLVVPAYHSYINNTDGMITRSHLMVNDDPYGSAAGWRIAAVVPGLLLTNECQAVELEPNHILLAARGLLTTRIQAESFDGGETFHEPYWIGIREPLGGCEGSIIYHRKIKTLFYSGTVNTNPERFNMTVWQSLDNGTSWQLGLVVNTGRTGYSSLQIMPDGHRVGLLYERSNLTDFIFTPTQISFLVVWPYPKKND